MLLNKTLFPIPASHLKPSSLSKPSKYFSIPPLRLKKPRRPPPPTVYATTRLVVHHRVSGGFSTTLRYSCHCASRLPLLFELLS